MNLEIPEHMLNWRKDFIQRDVLDVNLPRHIDVFEVDKVRCRARSMLNPYLKKKPPEGVSKGKVMDHLMAAMISAHMGPTHKSESTVISNGCINSNNKSKINVLPPPEAFLKKMPSTLYAETILSVCRAYRQITDHVQTYENDMMSMEYIPTLGKLAVTRKGDYRIHRYIEFMALMDAEIQWNE